jgi:hypothetical protein
MYAMFTGHSPFHGRTTIDIARRIDSFEPPPLCETHKAVPEFLSAIVQRLLKKDRESRYQTAAEVADVLNRHLAVLNSTPTDRLPEALKMQLAQTPRKGNRLLAAVVWPVLVVLGIAAAGIGLSYFGTGDMRPPTVPPVARVAAVTVAKSLTADFTTIGEALKHVAPGGSVTILDDAEYVEPIRLTDGSQHAAVRLVSPQRARLRSEGAGPVVFIRGIAGLRLEGLRIEAAHGQFGIEIHGSCPGLHLENIEIPRSPNTDGQTGTRAGLYLHYGAAGSAEQPIVVRGLALRSTIVGIVIGNTNVTDSPPRHILLEESLIEGIGRDQATLLVLKRHSEGVIIRRNLFVRGLQGLSVDAEERAFPEHCQISHNTWHDVRKWLAWKGPAPEQPSIRVTDNLIIDAEQLDIAFQARGLVSDATAAAIFANNVLFNRDGSSTDFSPLTRTVADVPILSFDSGQPDYLKPDIARWRASGQAPTPIPGRYSEPDLP